MCKEYVFKNVSEEECKVLKVVDPQAHTENQVDLKMEGLVGRKVQRKMQRELLLWTLLPLNLFPTDKKSFSIAKTY